jgi:cell division protein FtsZ
MKKSKEHQGHRSGTRRRARDPQEVDGMKLQLDFEPEQSAKIKVVGVGGAGGNAVNRMIESGFTGVDFVAINTDSQALGCCLAPDQVQVGRELTHGLGSGGNPEVGRRAVEEDTEVDMVFIAAGMGGGTGTGGAPVVAKMARNMGALVVAVVSKPFLFEGQYRMRQAVEGLQKLREEVDTSIVIPNQRLLAVASKDTPIREAFRIADEVLLRATRGVSDLIMVPGLVNLDFADVRSVMTGMGDAVMGTGISGGKNRAVEAAQQAISSPLLEDQSIVGAAGVLVNVTGGADLTLHEINEAATIINDAIGVETNMIFGAVIDDEVGDEVMITVIATGINAERKRAKPEAVEERRSEPARLKPRQVVQTPPQQKAPEPVEPPARNILVARSSNRRGSRRDLDIPTFLRRQMD